MAFAEDAITGDPVVQTTAATIDLTQIVAALPGLLATVITAYVAPRIKAKIGEERYNAALAVTRTPVEAAEQIYGGSGLGKEKLEYVKQRLEARGLTVDTGAIEAAVDGLCGFGEIVIEDEIDVAGNEETTEIE